MKVQIKKKLVSIVTVGYILGSMIIPTFATDTTSTSTHKHYVPKTLSSTASDTVTNEVVDGISFYITKINNANDEASSYSYIRAYLTGSSDTMWTVDTGSKYAPTVLTSTGGTTIKIKMKKNQYYEIFTASTQNNNISIYYYGNNSSKAAYVYIREGVNCEVSTD